MYINFLFVFFFSTLSRAWDLLGIQNGGIEEHLSRDFDSFKMVTDGQDCNWVILWSCDLLFARVYREGSGDKVGLFQIVID